MLTWQTHIMVGRHWLRAAKKGHKEVVQLLLDSGKADVNPVDKFGFTPLRYVKGKGHEAVAALLLAAGAVDEG